MIFLYIVMNLVKIRSSNPGVYKRNSRTPSFFKNKLFEITEFAPNFEKVHRAIKDLKFFSQSLRGHCLGNQFYGQNWYNWPTTHLHSSHHHSEMAQNFRLLLGSSDLQKLCIRFIQAYGSPENL